MKRQEQLQEAYEDALFTLLMNHVAELHGKQALQENRALREDPDAEVPQDIRRAWEILQKGGLVAIPTETVYGLAGNALCGETVKKIYQAKGRPSDNPLIVHISQT